MLPFVISAWAAPPPPVVETPAHVAAWRAKVDWNIARDEAVRLLSDYLKVDTRNPPGNEDLGVAFVGAFLDKEGIAWKQIPLTVGTDPAAAPEPGRSSLVARLAGAGKGPPLCLMHHVDVVTTEDARWPADKGPLSGAV